MGTTTTTPHKAVAKKSARVPNLIGLTIKDVGRATVNGHDEQEVYFVIELSDGGELWMEQDDEGNGPGTFFYSKGEAPEVHANEIVDAALSRVSKVQTEKIAAQKRILARADVFGKKAVAYWWQRHPDESRVGWTKARVAKVAHGHYQGMKAQGVRPTLSNLFHGQEQALRDDRALKLEAV